jgi:outer membrane lipoprotein-sorting protein
MSPRVLISCCLLAVAPLSFGADKEVEALLAKMRTAYKSVKTAHIVTRSKSPVPEGDLIVTSDITYQAPNKIRAKLNGFAVNAQKVVTLVSNGKTLTVMGLPQGNLDQPFTFQNFVQATGPALNLESLNFWDWKRQLSTAKGDNMEKSALSVVPNTRWAGKTWTMLEERAPESGVYVRYFIDPKTYFIHHVRVTDISGEQLQMDTEIRVLQTNVKVNESLFKAK